MVGYRKEAKRNRDDFSKFALSSMLSRRIRLPIERELLAELAKQGNNLNQVAARLNRDESLDRVGLKIIADDNAVLRQIYKTLGK